MGPRLGIESMQDNMGEICRLGFENRCSAAEVWLKCHMGQSTQPSGNLGLLVLSAPAVPAHDPTIGGVVRDSISDQYTYGSGPLWPSWLPISVTLIPSHHPSVVRHLTVTTGLSRVSVKLLHALDSLMCYIQLS